MRHFKEFSDDRPNQVPYKVHNTLIESKIVPCINAKPFNFLQDIFVTLPDFAALFCPGLDLEEVQRILEERDLNFYAGNRWLKQFLFS